MEKIPVQKRHFTPIYWEDTVFLCGMDEMIFNL